MLTRIKNPEPEEFVYSTSLAESAPRRSLTISAVDAKKLPPKVYVIIGVPYQSGTELILPREVTDHIIYLDSETQEDHLAATPIYYTERKFINVYHERDGITKDLVGTFLIDYSEPFTTVNIDADLLNSGKILYNYSGMLGKKTEDRVLNVTDAAGIISYKQGITGTDFLKRFRQAVFGNAYDTTVDDSIIYSLYNKSLDDFARIIAQEDRHYFDRLYTVEIVKGVGLYQVPYDLIMPNDVRISDGKGFGCTINQINPDMFPQECVKACAPEVCEILETDPCCPVTQLPKEECKSSCCVDHTYHWYFVDGMIGIYPIPNRTMTLSLRYSGSPEPLNAKTQINPLPIGFDMSLDIGAQYYWWGTMVHNVEAVTEFARIRQMYEDEKNQMRDHMRSRHMARNAFKPVTVRGRAAFPEAMYRTSKSSVRYNGNRY